MWILKRPFNALPHLELDVLIAANLRPKRLRHFHKQVLNAKRLGLDHSLLQMRLLKDNHALLFALSFLINPTSRLSQGNQVRISHNLSYVAADKATGSTCQIQQLFLSDAIIDALQRLDMHSHDFKSVPC